ncbi:ParB/RepB/Spo0J family partition protein [Klebsiella michiganensis]|jgi:ParB family chromosome partitioning protein|nr:ParB/RepB/Spo0J family partition protein [Klebsiella michiganensis]ELS4630016.1 ParB/RepB/Spo0J family partition protein [Klebsiella michiganensis]
MSATESKAKTPAKTSKKAAQAAAAETLKAALEAAPLEYVPLSCLVRSPLNVRVIPYPEASVRSMATSIKAVGLLQNLVVHTMPDGKSGVAAGGRRREGLNLLASEKEIDSEYRVPVKRVSDEVARLVSFIENDEHLSMHPAEQIYAFRDLSAQGMTPEQIGAQLGYGGRHVQRMLKLAGLAPELLTRLAKDEMTIEQCQALALENDPTRQLQVYENVKSAYGHTAPHLLKSAVTDREISLKSPAFEYIGRECYEAAGGVVREDLFSADNGEGTADKALTESLIHQKLSVLADEIQHTEGWAWSQVRSDPVLRWGNDTRIFQLTPVPEANYTADEQQRLDELCASLETTETHDDEYAIQAQIDEMESVAVNREWTPEQKAECGVVVSFWGAEVNIQRGVRQIAPERELDDQADQKKNTVITKKIENPVDSISEPLLKKMSSERTLAVQAALMQQPQKAVALMVWRLCSCVFDYGGMSVSHPFGMKVTEHYTSLVSDSPAGKTGKAWQTLMQEKARLQALLPEGWSKDFTTFFTLDGETLMSLMAFCTASSVYGVQTRECGHTRRSDLDGVETAIGFDMRDWWTPTADNFLSLLSKPQIVDALNEAGKTGAAADAGKMKKKDAAEHAEHALAETRWVPEWMQPPATAKPVITDDAADADDHTAHAA